MSARYRRFAEDRRIVAPPRVVVVGPCGAGKSTLAEALRDAGVDAHTTAQEHSMIPDLWRRRQPDLLVYLDVDLETVRARRDASWLRAIYLAQTERLVSARNNADLEICTDSTTRSEMVEQALELVAKWRLRHADRRGIPDLRC